MTLGSRNKAKLHLHCVNTTYCLRSTKYMAVSLWNDLSQYIKDIESINKFKQSTNCICLNNFKTFISCIMSVPNYAQQWNYRIFL